MADSANVSVVRRFYENLSSPEVLMQVLSPTISWEITPGFPYGGDYVGVNAVFRDFFGRVLSDFDDWRTVMHELHDAGDRVLALGTYSGRAKTTGKTFIARFSALLDRRWWNDGSPPAVCGHGPDQQGT